MIAAHAPLASTGNAAFFVIFGIFIVAMVVLVVIVIVWAVRHDIAGRREWRQRQEARTQWPDDPEGRAVMSIPSGENGQPLSWARRLRGRWARLRPSADGRHGVTPQRTAFVLAGGGSRGAVQVGMLEELIRRGIRADRVFGASVGAINGAAYAGNPTLAGAEHMADIWRAVKGTDIFPRGTFDGPWAFFQKRAAVHANTGLRAIIEAGIDYEDLEDALIPVEVVTTSLTDGRERWITHGPAVEAILASSAIPSIFPPVTIDGDVLVDGGVVNNVPISRALSAGCDRIYVLLCGPLHFHPPPPRRPAEAALTAFFVAVHARFVRELAALPPGIEVVVFSGGGEPSGQYRDFSATAALIEEGRAEVNDVLDRYAGTTHDLAVVQAPSVTE